MDQSGKLYQPLGQWLYDRARLKRIWNDYYEVDTKNAYCREGSCWRQFVKIRKKYQKDNLLQWTPNERSVPCRLININKNTVQINKLTWSQSKEATTGNIQEAIDDQPEGIWQLLENHTWHIELFEAKELIEKEGGSIHAVSDGSSTDACISFGWVIATKTGIKIASGNSKGYRQTSSHQAESYDMVAVTAFLQIWKNFVDAKDVKLALWCDNKKLIQQVRQRFEYEDSYTIATLALDWDTVE